MTTKAKPISIKNAKSNQDNHWHLNDSRMQNNFEYVRIKK